MLAEDAIKSAISNYYTKNPNAKATDLSGAKASSLSKAGAEDAGMASNQEPQLAAA